MTIKKVIDDNGNIWSADSRELRSIFHLADVDGDIGCALVRNVGFIAVARRGTSASIQFNPRTVAPTALAALGYWLAQGGPDRICLSVLDTVHRQSHEMHPTPQGALRRMQGLIDKDRQRRGELPFRQQHAELRDLPSASVLSAVFECWRATAGVFCDDAYKGPLHQFGGKGRYLLVHARHDAGRFEIIKAGEGLLIPDKISRARLVGSTLEDIPDYAYGRWVTHDYRQVLEEQWPRFDHVRAAILWPGTGRVVRRYSRLLLPCQSQSGERLVLGVSDKLASSNFELEAA